MSEIRMTTEDIALQLLSSREHLAETDASRLLAELKETWLTEAAGQPATRTPNTPDLHAVITDAVSTFQTRPYAGGYDQQLTNHILTAVAPLVPYREVWDASLPPGGRCCGNCGMPVESEPCPDHAPTETREGGEPRG